MFFFKLRSDVSDVYVLFKNPSQFLNEYLNYQNSLVTPLKKCVSPKLIV